MGLFDSGHGDWNLTPKELEKSMRQVHTNDMVAHLWANQSQQCARSNNGNFYFEDDTIYSYGSHFPIAKHVDNVVLFTTDTYSPTTGQHCSIVSSACSHLKTFHVPLISADDREDHQYNLKNYIERIEQELLSASRARKYGEFHLEPRRKTQSGMP